MTSLIIVNGHPGSGKTTLATCLADELGIPCITKDLFKEALYEHALPADREASRDLGRLAYDLAFTAVEAVLASRTSAILEAPLHRRFSQARVERIAAEHRASVIQVLLTADADVLEARYVARRATVGRHEGHDVGFTVSELRSGLAKPFDALEVAATIELDTNDFALIDRDALLADLRTLLRPRR